jgi:hypothetical protein
MERNKINFENVRVDEFGILWPCGIEFALGVLMGFGVLLF